eukprot:TRINITY_DN2865_c0_g1_i3.p1 TRINITY_DN2865_c0_g1~~TRINITY_DN2865_c0_g1_i3.p1  ORF type:complete len:686 (+),score=202.00 TRINITY_DN2865_c0_g1_i3:113-2170(+)
MSLVEDWEDERDDHSSRYNPTNEILNTNPYSVPVPREEEEAPIFSIASVDYKPSDAIKSLVVCSNILVMALANGHIVRINLKKQEELEDIEITRKDQIHKIFLDPSGNHLIISLETEDNYYIHTKWKKPKILSKMKGVVVESVAWDKQNPDSTNTREILIGTTKGRIFETLIEASEKAFMERIVGGKEQIFKPVYNMGDNSPVTGLQFERFPTGPGEPIKYFIMATSPTRIYQFIGGPTFEQVFAKYETTPGFLELPGEILRSELCFFSKYLGQPKSFAWLTGPGIYHGDLLFGSQNAGDSVMVDTSLLAYPRNIDRMTLPISMVLTEFHFILLYEDKIQAISTLSKNVPIVVWEETFTKSARLGRVWGLSYDPIARLIWMYAQYSVFEVVIVKEDRNVWEMYLEKEQYAEALQHCKTISQRDRVWSAQADHYFARSSFKLAAEYYGKSLRSFEEITLKLIGIQENEALKVYLSNKLQNIRNNKSKDATQLTMIATWLTEIYLDKLNQIQDDGAKNSDALEVLEEEFYLFLREYKDNLDRATTFSLISSHGRTEELVFYATIIEDFERVIAHHIQHNNYTKALEVMSKQSNEEVYYKFSPVLMHHIPQQTVDAWIRAPFLDPRKLIPALMRYDSSKDNVNQAIRYLQHCVKNQENKDPAIHNLLLSLFAAEKDERPLLEFLSVSL